MIPLLKKEYVLTRLFTILIKIKTFTTLVIVTLIRIYAFMTEII